MEIMIIGITALAIISLGLGFFEIGLPVLRSPFPLRSRKISKHNRKMLRKKIWHNEFHKGFVTLPTSFSNKAASGL
jgi:hypothetical protein